MEDLLLLLEYYGIDVLILGVIVSAITGIVKLPLKAWAQKSINPEKWTRFIVFLPIVLGFGLIALKTYLCNGGIKINTEFIKEWISSVSISLLIYAFWEKFIPSKKKILSEAEIEENRKVVDYIKGIMEEKQTENSDESEDASGDPIIDVIKGLMQLTVDMSDLTEETKRTFIKEKTKAFAEENKIEVFESELEEKIINLK